MRRCALRQGFVLLTCLSTLVATGAAAGAQNGVQANGVFAAGRQGGLNLDAMSQRIFDESDHNHNGVLSRTEYSTAQLLTESTVANLGRQGLIGRGRPITGGVMPVGGLGGPLGHVGMLGQGGMLAQAKGLNNLRITNDNHVTQPQFNNYFRNAVAVADSAWRQLYAANRRTNGRAYPHYGRGYGRNGYGHRGYNHYGGARPQVIVERVASPQTHAHHAATSGQNTNGNSTAGQNVTARRSAPASGSFSYPVTIGGLSPGSVFLGSGLAGISKPAPGMGTVVVPKTTTTPTTGSGVVAPTTTAGTGTVPGSHVGVAEAGRATKLAALAKHDTSGESSTAEIGKQRAKNDLHTANHKTTGTGHGATTTAHSGTKSSGSAHLKASTEKARARLTAMARSRAAAQHASASGGGGNHGGGNHGGGGHHGGGGGGGGGHHGGGGGGHHGGGGSGHHGGGGHHR